MPQQAFFPLVITSGECGYLPLPLPLPHVEFSGVLHCS